MGTAKCSYSKKFKSLVEEIIIKAGQAQSGNPEQEILKELDQLFVSPDAKTIYDLVSADMDIKPTIKPDNIHTTTQLSLDKKQATKVIAATPGHRVDRMFTNAPEELHKMKISFSTSMTGFCVAKMNWTTGKLDFVNDDIAVLKNGVTTLNYRIAEYKLALINKISNGNYTINDIIVDDELSDKTFQEIYNKEMALYASRVSNNSSDIKVTDASYIAYAMLSHFDDLLMSDMPFIHVKSSHKDKNTLNKYEYVGPTVKHYSNYGETDVNVMESDSDLARILLNIIPDWDFKNGVPKYTTDAFGNKIATIPVGLPAFHMIGGTMKGYLFFNDNKELQKYQQEFYDKGLEFDFANFLSIFIDHCNNVVKDNSMSSFYADSHTCYLMSKMEALRRYVFTENMPVNIRNMFISMFNKTEVPTYRAYKEVNDEFHGVDLKTHNIDVHQRQLKKAIQSAVSMLKQTAIKQSLIEQFNIIPNYNDGSIRLTAGETIITLTPSTDSKKQLQVDVDVVGDLDEDTILKDLIFKTLQQIVPEDYNTCMGVKNIRDWKQDYGNVLYAVLSTMFSTADVDLCEDLHDKDGDFNGIRLVTQEIAQRRSILFGSESKSVVVSPSGSKLPNQVLTCLNYQLFSLLNDFSKEDNSYQENFIYKNRALMGASQIRNEVNWKGKIKNASKMTERELMQLSIVDDFFTPLFDDANTDGTIQLQNATFADKGTHFLQTYNLGKVRISTPDGEITLKDLVKKVAQGDKAAEETLKETIYKSRHARYVKIEQQILEDYKKAFNGELDYCHNLSDVEEYLQCNMVSEKELRTRFKDIDLPQEIYFQMEATPDGKKHVVLNNTLLDYCETYRGEEMSPRFKRRVNESNSAFADSLEENNVCLYAYSDPRANKISGFIDRITGKTTFAVNGQLSPVATAYSLTNMLLSNEFNSLMIGEVYAHPNKCKAKRVPYQWARMMKAAGLPINGNSIAFFEQSTHATYEVLSGPEYTEILDLLASDAESIKAEYNAWKEENPQKISKYLTPHEYDRQVEATRLIAQIKRTVIPGATIHPFNQGVKAGDELKDKFIKKGADISIPLHTKVACIKDLEGASWNIAGEDKTDNDAMDGSGFSSPLMALLENYSLIDAAVNYNKKTIMADVDPKTGRPTLLKWAVYGITNEYRRNSSNSRVNGNAIFKKMHNIQLNDEAAADKVVAKINEMLDGISTGLWVDDYATGTYKHIVKADAKDGKVEVTYEDGVIQSFNCNTLADIDAILGGAYAGTMEDGKFKYTEHNLLLNTALICENPKWKEAFIGYLVNKSAIKVGQVNLNDRDRWTDDEALQYFTMSTRYGGVQMDADHELELAEVTEMTQMISALIEDGHYVDIVNDIYSTIGETVFTRLQDMGNALETGNKEELYRILAKALIDSFNGDSKDTIGLAQAYLKEAEAALKSYNEKADEKISFKVPFSAGTISGAFISQVTSDINRNGIKHKYDGLASVLNPSRDMIQYYDVNGHKMLFRQYVDEMRNYTIEVDGQEVHPFVDAEGRLKDFVLQNPASIAVSLSAGKLTLDELVATGFVSGVDNEHLDIEDTILIPYSDGTWKIVSLDSWHKLDEYKHLRDAQTYVKLNFAPKNLKQSDYAIELVDANGVLHTVSMYDLDAVRATFYLKDGGKLTEQQLAVIRQALSNSRLVQDVDTLMEEVVVGNTAAALSILKIETKAAMKALDTNNGKEFTYAAALIGPAILQKSTYKPAQCIMGRYHGSKFGLTTNDHIYKINSSDYFYDKLRDKYAFNDCPQDCRDITLYRGNSQYIVKNGNNDTLIELQKAHPDAIITPDTSIEHVEGKYYDVDGNFICKDNDVKFYNLTLDNKSYKFILTEDASKLTRSPFFDAYKVYNITDENLSKQLDVLFKKPNPEGKIKLYTANGKHVWITREEVENSRDPKQLIINHERVRRRKELSKAAKLTYAAFKAQLTCTGARIPTQAMQSFMPMEIIAYTDVEDNQIYVAQVQTWLQGSDYKSISYIL